jgi:hypothetical protein
VYEEALDNWMQRKNSKLQPLLFTEFINRYPDLAWDLSPSLLKCTAATNSDASKGKKDKGGIHARSSYARCEALRLLTQLLRANAAHGTASKKTVKAEVEKAWRGAFEKTVQEAAAEDTADLQVGR